MTATELKKPWQGWHFYEDYFCSPNGDRFTPLAILATVFYRQMNEVKKIMYDWPKLIQ